MPEATLVTCLGCKGKKGGWGFVDGRDPKTGKRFGGSAFLQCRDCFGTGEVSEAVSEFLQEADRRLDARRESGRSLLDVAQEMGVKVIELNHMYVGRSAFPDQMNLPAEVIGGAYEAAELDAKAAIKQASYLAAAA